MLAFLLLAVPLALPAAAPAAARVNGHEIAAADLEERIRLTRAAAAAGKPEDLVQDLVNEELLAEEAERLGLGADPEVQAAADQAQRRAASARFVAKEIDGSVQIRDDLLEQMYRDSADSAQLATIIVASKEEAQAILDRLGRGGDFAQEARASLDSRGAQSGGVVQQSRGQLDPALKELAFSAPLGELRGPVQLSLGWAVVKVVSRELADPKEYERRRPELRKYAEQQVRTFAKSHYLQQLRSRYHAAIDEEFIKSTGTALTAAPEQAAHVLATVGGRTVTYGEVLSEMARLFRGKGGGHLSGTTVKGEIASYRADQLLLEQAALDAGYAKDPEVAAAAARAQRAALVQRLAKQLRAGAAAPTAAELEAFYGAHRQDYLRPWHRSCAHLLVESRDQAAALRDRARGGSDFEELGGKALGDLDEQMVARIGRPDAEPALARAIREAEAGRPTDPIQSRAGWHVLRCGPAAAAAPAPLQEVRDAVAQRMAAERGDAAVRARIAELRGKAQISVDAEAVRRAGASSS